MAEYQPVSQVETDLIELEPVAKSQPAAKPQPEPVKKDACALCKREAVLHKVMAPSYMNYCVYCAIKKEYPYNSFEQFRNNTPCSSEGCRYIGSCGFATAWQLCDACDKWKPKITKITVTANHLTHVVSVSDRETPLTVVNKHFREKLGLPADAKLMISRARTDGADVITETTTSFRELGIKDSVKLIVSRVY